MYNEVGLLGQMVRERAAATWKDAMPKIRAAIVAGKLDAAQGKEQFDLQLSNCMRSLRRKLTGVAAATAEALKRLSAQGVLDLGELNGGRPAWGAWEKKPKGAAAVRQVERRMRDWLDAELDAGRKVDASRLRSTFRKQHWDAGGLPDEHTTAINEALMERQMAGRLWKQPLEEANKVLVLFSGGQSGTDPARELGLETVNVDIANPYKLSDKEERWVEKATDLTAAPEEGMIEWAASEQGCDPDQVLVASISQPCHVWSAMGPINKKKDAHFLGKTGRPRRDKGTKIKGSRAEGKRAEAEKQQALAQNMSRSVYRWLLKWAIRGIQRFYYVENGRWGQLRNQEFMRALNEPMTVHYCRYRVWLHLPGVYPAQKATGIWTNLQDWDRRECPRTGWHEDHPAKIGARKDNKVRLEGLDLYSAKRWMPQELQLELLRAAL